MVFFCPQCWKEINAADAKCPHCGADITEHEKKEFEEKLINALRHPERETVQRAVWILGRLKSVKAVMPVIKLFEQTDNSFLKMEILDALGEIGTPAAGDFIVRSVDSKISIVKEKAKRLINRKIQTSADCKYYAE